MMDVEGARALNRIGGISRGAIRDKGPWARGPAGVSQPRSDDSEGKARHGHEVSDVRGWAARFA